MFLNLDTYLLMLIHTTLKGILKIEKSNLQTTNLIYKLLIMISLTQI